MNGTRKEAKLVVAALNNPSLKTSLEIAGLALRNYKTYVNIYEKVSDPFTCDVYREEIDKALNDIDNLKLLLNQLEMGVLK